MAEKEIVVESPRIHLSQFEQQLNDLYKGGRQELIGAFLYHAQHVKKLTHDTEDNFRKSFEEFKTMKF